MQTVACLIKLKLPRLAVALLGVVGVPVLGLVVSLLPLPPKSILLFRGATTPSVVVVDDGAKDRLELLRLLLLPLRLLFEVANLSKTLVVARLVEETADFLCSSSDALKIGTDVMYFPSTSSES